MSKTFRDWSLDQALLLPPSVHDFVPAGHLSRFVVALVTEELDLSAILASYQGEKGQPPYHPAMMVALLLYAYAVGIYSSRRIAKACVERIDFMSIVALDAPDFRTISEFRRRHLAALAALFVQVLKLCERAGLVKLGHVALDGTKIKANASKHKAMSYQHMGQREAELQAEVDGWLKSAEAADAAEDKAFGADRRGDEMPDWVANKQARLANQGKQKEKCSLSLRLSIANARAGSHAVKRHPELTLRRPSSSAIGTFRFDRSTLAGPKYQTNRRECGTTTGSPSFRRQSRSLRRDPRRGKFTGIHNGLCSVLCSGLALSAPTLVRLPLRERATR